MPRLTPLTSTIRRLFALSGNECAFPGCTHSLINKDGVYIAQVCHIEAAEVGGQRYNINQTDEERRAFENLILLCHEHHKVTDDVMKYDVSDLKLMKDNHEQRFLNMRYELENEALDQVLDSISEKLDHVIMQNNYTHSALNVIQQEVAIISSSRTIFSGDQENLYNDMLKIGIDFRSSNQFIVALDFFQKLEKDKWDELSDGVRFKLLANIGVTLLEIGRNQEAALYFLRISEVDDETVDGLAYICLGYAILKQVEQFDHFFNKAVSLGTDNPNLWLAFLLCKGGTLPASTLQEKIPTNLLKLNFIIIKLLELHNSEGNLYRSKELLWKIEASIARDDYKDWQIINSYIGLTVSSILTAEKLQQLIFSSKEFDAVKRAIELYTRVIALLGNGGADKVLSTTYYNRSLCYMALSKDAEAERDLEKSWSTSSNFTSFKGLFLFHLRNNRFGRCELLLEEWKQKQGNPKAEERFETLVCEARLWAMQGANLRFESTLIDAYDEISLEYKPLVLDNLVLNGVLVGDYNLVLQYSNKLIAEFSDYVYGYIGLFAYNMKKKNLPEALNALKGAKDKNYDKLSEAFIWMQLADGFCELKEYDEALAYFDKLKQYNSFNPMAPRFAECHYYLGNYEQVISLLGDKDFVDLDFISHQLLFWSYYNLGLHEKVENILKQGLGFKNSESVNFFRKLAAHYYSERDLFNKAKDIILAIDNFDDFEVMEAFSLVSLLWSMGYIRESFDLAYKLRVQYYDTFEAQKYYFDLYVHSGNSLKNKGLYLKLVQENTLVVLSNKNKKEYKYYLAGDNIISDGVRLESNDQLWNVLLNATTGQAVVLPNTMGNFKIKEIWSRYLIAFRDSMFLLENKYADRAGMYFGSFN